MSRPADLIQGTLDLLILKTLALEPRHGWGIGQRIEQVSQRQLRVQQGTLYPALHRLEQQGWIEARWETTENSRRAKVYLLTAAGRKRLRRELAEWERLSGAVGLVIGEA